MGPGFLFLSYIWNCNYYYHIKCLYIKVFCSVSSLSIPLPLSDIFLLVLSFYISSHVFLYLSLNALPKQFPLCAQSLPILCRHSAHYLNSFRSLVALIEGQCTFLEVVIYPVLACSSHCISAYRFSMLLLL